MKIFYDIKENKPVGAFRTTPYMVNGEPGKLPENIIELDVVYADRPLGNIVITQTGWDAHLKAGEYRQFYEFREKTREELVEEFNTQQAAKDAELNALKVKEVLRNISEEKEFLIHYKADEPLRAGDKRIYEDEVLIASKEHTTDIEPDSRNYELKETDIKR